MHDGWSQSIIYGDVILKPNTGKNELSLKINTTESDQKIGNFSLGIALPQHQHITNGDFYHQNLVQNIHLLNLSLN